MTIFGPTGNTRKNAKQGDYYIDSEHRCFVVKTAENHVNSCDGCAFQHTNCMAAPACMQHNAYYVLPDKDESARVISLARLKGLL